MLSVLLLIYILWVGSRQTETCTYAKLPTVPATDAIAPESGPALAAPAVTALGAYIHSWAQAQLKLSRLSPIHTLNILLSINSLLLSLGFTDLTDLTINGCILRKFYDQRFQWLKKM